MSPTEDIRVSALGKGYSECFQPVSEFYGHRGKSADLVVNGVKMHANHFLITDFLKKQLPFRGFVILRVKFTMGLFENPHADTSLVGELGKQKHRDLGREAVRKPLVLLKNGKPGDRPVLPLPKKAHDMSLIHI
ncbi:hypothetical protein BAE44_0024935 [Dichanthelium oligosanthes]|uniref:Uncharacterized protein n=1 Tax=Dichanthelium oligosanthes TaxID=888268 RepID=A0A1E5UMG0_9POAL|nr:hypothetical protein BAE44_0024935 [Dichanthelium oligosanthes]